MAAITGSSCFAYVLQIIIAVVSYEVVVEKFHYSTAFPKIMNTQNCPYKVGETPLVIGVCHFVGCVGNLRGGPIRWNLLIRAGQMLSPLLGGSFH